MAEAAGLSGGLGGTMFRIGGGHIFIGVELANDALVEAVLSLEACEVGQDHVQAIHEHPCTCRSSWWPGGKKRQKQ